MDTFCKKDGKRCSTHGTLWPCTTQTVLQEVALERSRQYARYGSNNNLENGTGVNSHWVAVDDAADCTARDVEARMRLDYEKYEARHGKPTWMHLVREEIAEAFQESDPDRLEEEVVQVAALCVSWIETLRERREWAVEDVNTGKIVKDHDWHGPDDIMRTAHGLDAKGPVRILYRDSPDEEWKRKN